jgi:Domain of unknown function (DUF4159)/Aerotolerance regulator N-terminal
MMALLQSIGFGTPLALFGLLALPIIWWLLRFTPPKPRPQAFPPVRILLDLPKQDETPDKTPWWLLLLRLVMAALVIFLVAQPFLQPATVNGLPRGLRLVIVDDGWAAAQNWQAQRLALNDILEGARAQGDSVVLTGTAPRTSASDLAAEAARAALDRARVLSPSPLSTDRMALLEKLKSAPLSETKSIIWLADGLDVGNAGGFVAGLTAAYPDAALRIIAPPALPLALSQPKLANSEISIDLLAPVTAPATAASLSVKATNGRILLDVPLSVKPGGSTTVTFALPTALRNEIQSIAIAGQGHAGARQLLDDRWRRRVIALQSMESAEQAQPLLSPLHYVSRGLEPYAELFEPQTPADVANLIDAGLSMLVLADVGAVPEDVAPKVSEWIEKGGILLRFAGPRLAAGHDGLVPVKLREGDRTLGSALSWETPQSLQEFPPNSPFAGLTIDPRITVTRQVLADPDLDLAAKTWASLADGTPLVTAETRGKGLVVLFHVTANANWSNLPLSGLFVEMMSRVAGLDTAQQVATASDAPQSFAPRLVMTGDGNLVSADGTAQPIAAAAFEAAVVSALTPPGLYARGGTERALNHAMTAEMLTPMAATVSGVAVSAYAPQAKASLVGPLSIAALLLFLADCLATLWIGGGLSRFKSAAAAVFLLLIAVPPPQAMAQDMNMQAALNPRLAFVKTGSDEIDGVSEKGLSSLTLVLSDRTSADLAEPFGVDVNTDDLTFYPLLYWPVPADAAALSDATRTKVAAYMKNGGTIFFDLRSGGLDSGSSSEALRRILDKLDVPPLEPVPEKHVLTRSFYLLTMFPGRYEDGPLWVESSLGDPSTDPGTADGVSAIIIGSNDYAAAWALDEVGNPLYAVVPGSDRQREFAFRTGINVVMYALTGNYKADQVHVPALLERLGQ